MHPWVHDAGTPGNFPAVADGLVVLRYTRYDIGRVAAYAHVECSAGHEGERAHTRHHSGRAYHNVYARFLTAGACSIFTRNRLLQPPY
jgi:hypothetical protein